MSERYQEENERYQEDPIAPEHLKKLTIERMPYEEVFFLNVEYEDEDSFTNSDVWVDRDLNRFFVSSDIRLDLGDNEYPGSVPDEETKFPVMRVVLFQDDGSFTDSLIADFRRTKEDSIPVEDSEMMEIPDEKIIQIDAFISFDELDDDKGDVLDEDREVVFSGDPEYYEVLRYLRDKVDGMREEQREISRLELEAEEAYKLKNSKRAKAAAKLGSKATQGSHKLTGDQ